MASGHDAQAAGERIESLLAELRSNAGPQVADTAEELVSCLVELYGAGLAEILRIIGEDAEAGPRLMDDLVADPLVESLLLVHDLHPLDTGARVQRAIDQVLPQLGSHAGKVEYRGIDDAGRHPPDPGTQRRARLRVHRGHGPGGDREVGDGSGPGGGWRRYRGGRGSGGTAAAADQPAPGRVRGDPVTTWGAGTSGGPGARAGTSARPVTGLRRFVKRRRPPPAPGAGAGASRAVAGAIPRPRRPRTGPGAAIRTGRGRRDSRSRPVPAVPTLPRHRRRHGHLVDTDKRSLACACRACYLLFTHQGAGTGGRYRAYPSASASTRTGR